MTTDEDSDDLSARTLELARQAVRGAPLLRDYARDLAQEAMTELLARGLRRPRNKQIADTVRRLAEREKKHRRREAQRAAQRAAETKTPDAPRRVVPPLLPRLAGLAPFAPDAGRFRCVLRSAIHLVATDPGVLQEKQQRLFELAHVEGLPLDRLTRVLGVSTDRATQERLRRISDRIGPELLVRVRPLLSKPSRATVRKIMASTPSKARHLAEKISNDTSEAMKRACVELVTAAEAMIDRKARHPLS